jgi:plasmid rolling circle replication initiator protein Rep
MSEGTGQADPSFYLTDLSPNDKPWDRHKDNATKVAGLYDGSELSRYAARMKDCGGTLGFNLLSGDGGEIKFKLNAARFCRVRHCPICQWRRSLVWRARFFNAIPNVLADYPRERWVFLTLTVRNCPIKDLRETVAAMNAGWKRLTLRKQFPAKGYVRSLEVTRGSDGSAHPHFHVLMMVNPSYFSGSTYLSQSKWGELWKNCLRVDYVPMVNIKVVKPKQDEEKNGITLAILETLKYGVKETDLTTNKEWLIELTKQLHKIRAVTVSGILKKYLSDDEPEDLINTDLNDEEEESEKSDMIWFGWREIVKRYAKIER